MTANQQPGDAGPGALGRQLIRQAEAISRLRHDLDRLASEVTDSITDLQTRLNSTEDPPASASASAPAMAWGRPQ